VHQIRFRPGVRGKLTAPPDSLSGLRRPYFEGKGAEKKRKKGIGKGREREGEGRGSKGVEEGREREGQERGMEGKVRIEEK